MSAPTWPPPGPLCTAGRCAEILKALATGGHVETLVQRQADHLGRVVTGALTRLGHDADDPAVSAAIAAEIRLMLAETPGG